MHELNGHAAFMPGSRVRLTCPDNPRLDGAAAVVGSVTPWGAHVLTGVRKLFGRYSGRTEELP